METFYHSLRMRLLNGQNEAHVQKFLNTVGQEILCRCKIMIIEQSYS